ncbi:CDP-alcohol phosphatidyltransferase family protein [Carnobacterium sp. ISL-102]|uniref:CDP-alcohol phosphatidyltransferase family protein n=1 Tax=Carnobacterium sp. ISL-102 TaxID=2819142 RepID=UPI001BEC69D6|nr:CDP-alcohol phosphatidyltransferase family protein [Carnobacterium sp. ISL-102]MBT2731330.1 CDP-alcohol phosphatidyltransferase family protein [Carnobacterium sp. ISL-102]
MKSPVRDFFTVPNILSYIRLLLIPIFTVQYLTATETKDYYLAGMIVVFSGLTDLLDGIIARKLNQITEVGKLLDPVADKLTQIAVIICLMSRYEKMWIVILLFIAKELFMAINAIILYRQGKKLDGAKWFGKIATAVFYACMTFLVAFPTIQLSTATSLMIITGFFLGLSFLLYGREFFRMYQK